MLHTKNCNSVLISTPNILFHYNYNFVLPIYLLYLAYVSLIHKKPLTYLIMCLFQSLNREESPNNATSPRQFTSPPQSPPSSPPVTNNIQSAGSIPVANHNNLHGQMTSPVAKPSANQSQGTPAGVNSFQTGAPTVITGTAPTTITTGHHHHHPHHQRVGSNSSHEPGEGWASFEDDEHAGK